MFDRNLTDTVDQIQKDINSFVETELSLYMSQDNQNFSNSVIANIALLNMESLDTENGYTQMERLLSSHYDQMVERRMHQLLHKLYIRYGKDKIHQVKNRVVETMHLAYPVVPAANFWSLSHTHNTFWLVPFIKQAYELITLTTKK